MNFYIFNAITYFLFRYSSNVAQAFSSMMLMHITLTSFEISVLGFEVLMVTSFTDSLRFGMHLLGWIILLFLICNYGQKMIDEVRIRAEMPNPPFCLLLHSLPHPGTF